MKLRVYLVENQISIKKFAEMIKYNHNHISQMMRGKRKPSLRLAETISKATNGEVTVDEIMKDNPK
jgi:DNA-binding transcriptional regulator YdaS (Cro superfamily)